MAVALLNEIRRRESAPLVSFVVGTSNHCELLTVATAFTPEAALLMRLDDQFNIFVNKGFLCNMISGLPLGHPSIPSQVNSPISDGTRTETSFPSTSFLFNLMISSLLQRAHRTLSFP